MKNTNLNIKSVKLQRTLIIVIGGSGAEAMISNRRRTIDQFGSLEAMPLVRISTWTPIRAGTRIISPRSSSMCASPRPNT